MDYRELYKLANSGHVIAQFDLGNLYSQSIGIDHYLHEAYLYCQSIGINQDLHEAYYWFNKASLSGHLEAKFRVGLFLLLGQGINRDVDKGLDALYEVANEGHTAAQLTIGSTLLEGKIVEQDLVEARHWLTEAAESCDPNAQYNLGKLYTHPRSSDYCKAYKWFCASINNKTQHSEDAKIVIKVLRDKLTNEEIKNAESEACKYY